MVLHTVHLPNQLMSIVQVYFRKFSPFLSCELCHWPESLVPCQPPLRPSLFECNCVQLMKCLCTHYHLFLLDILSHTVSSSTNTLVRPGWQLGPDGVCYFGRDLQSNPMKRTRVSLSHSQVPDVSLISLLSSTSHFSGPNQALTQCHVQSASFNTTALVTISRW